MPDGGVACFSCNSEFKEKTDTVLNCDYCDFWFCIKCVSINKTEYN